MYGGGGTTDGIKWKTGSNTPLQDNLAKAQTREPGTKSSTSYMTVQRDSGDKNMAKVLGERGYKKDADRGGNGRLQRSRMPERSDKAPGRVYYLYRASNEPCMVVLRYQLVLVIRTRNEVNSRNWRRAHRSRNGW